MTSPIEAISTREDSDISAAASCLKAAGDNLRLQILASLSSDSFGVLELCQIFETKQSGMSHHLKVLANAGLVNKRREGNTIFYRRCDDEITEAEAILRNAIYALADTLKLPETVSTNLEQVYRQRADASKLFFLENADAFREQQELIAAYNVYGPEVAQVLTYSPYEENACALEVGPGAGEFLPELSRRFAKVIALDSSAVLLQQSREFCFAQQLANISFVHNDTAYCRSLPAAVDCVVINMVLHHTASPSHIFADAAHCIKPGGVLLVCDLSAHDQDWVREACGDQWLGFDTDDLRYWATKVNLKEGVSRYFALRNGFQIQIHQFIKQ